MTTRHTRAIAVVMVMMTLDEVLWLSMMLLFPCIGLYNAPLVTRMDMLYH